MSLLYRRSQVIDKIICTHPVFIVHTHSNHSKSQTVTPQTFKIKFTQLSSYKNEKNPRKFFLPLKLRDNH